MKIVIIGGSGLIGSKLVNKLDEHGHEAIAASPDSGGAHPADGADDVVSEVGRVSVGAPLNGMVEIARPEQFRLDELIRGVLTKRNDPREVVTDPQARYFGINSSERALVPGADARVAETRLSDWLQQQLAAN
jgi:nucleoside-diphosphate-sugar epimerase